MSLNFTIQTDEVTYANFKVKYGNASFKGHELFKDSENPFDLMLKKWTTKIDVTNGFDKAKLFHILDFKSVLFYCNLDNEKFIYLCNSPDSPYSSLCVEMPITDEDTFIKNLEAASIEFERIRNSLSYGNSCIIF